MAEVKLERSRKVVDFVELLKRANGDSQDIDDKDSDSSGKRAGDFSSSAESVGYQRISMGLLLAVGLLLTMA